MKCLHISHEVFKNCPLETSVYLGPKAEGFEILNGTKMDERH